MERFLRQASFGLDLLLRVDANHVGDEIAHKLGIRFTFGFLSKGYSDMRQALVVTVILGSFGKLFSDDVLGHVDAVVFHLMGDVVEKVI